MVTIGSLWLAILVASVAVFFASFLAWMVVKHHDKDVQALPDEKALTNHLNTLSLRPGFYMWPNCANREDMNSQEFKERYAKGPWGNLTVIPQQPSFGRNLLLTFLCYVIVSVFVAYLTGQARGPGAGFMEVFQVAGTAGILAYCAGSIPNAIFFGKPGRFVLTDFVDGVVHGLVTGVVFAWLWPGVEAVGA